MIAIRLSELRNHGMSNEVIFCIGIQKEGLETFYKIVFHLVFCNCFWCFVIV